MHQTVQRRIRGGSKEFDMKIKVEEKRAVITDNAPLIIDVREKNYIDVELPDDKTYFVGFIGTITEKREVLDCKVELPKTFFTEQTLQLVIYRADGESITAIPCEPIKLYCLNNKAMFLMYVENAIGQEDVRNKAEMAMAQCYAMAEMLKNALSQINSLTEEFDKIKTDLEGFHSLYNENVEKINDVIRRVEIMEADYDVLVK